MTESLILALAWLAGGGLGAIFFGGLWWTVQRTVASRRPARLLLGSVLLRMSLTVTGFYFVASGHWERLLLCLVGFVMARQIVTRLTRPSGATVPTSTREVRDAPQP